jgi:hypothetical protein
MSTQRDITRIVRSWMKVDAHESADRVLDAVLDALPSTPQRRTSWFARRSTPMSTTLRLAIAAAALVVVAVLGYQFLPDPGVGTGNTPHPTPSASGATSSSTPAATLAPRSHLWLDGSTDGPAATVTIPGSGWSGLEGNGVLISRLTEDPPNGAAFIGPFYGALYVYGDPCHWSTSKPATPVTTVDEFVAAITAQRDRDASEPADVTIGGYSGVTLTLHVPDDADFSACDEGNFGSWNDASDADPGPSRHSQAPGQIDQLWVLDVDGTLTVIDAGYYAGTPPELVDEMRTIIESTTFEVGP